MEDLHVGPEVFAVVDIERAGVFLTLDRNGVPAIYRGFVRPEDEARAIGGGGEANDDDEDAEKPLRERLLIELTAHRFLALRDAVGRNPRVALTLLLYKLVQDVFRTNQRGGCLDASVREVYVDAQPVGLNDCLAAKAFDERHSG